MFYLVFVEDRGGRDIYQIVGSLLDWQFLVGGREQRHRYCYSNQRKKDSSKKHLVRRQFVSHFDCSHGHYTALEGTMWLFRDRLSKKLETTAPLRSRVGNLLEPDLKEFGTSADQIPGVVYESVCPIVRSFSDWIVLIRAAPRRRYHDLHRPPRGKVQRGWPGIYSGPNFCLAKGQQAHPGVYHRSSVAKPACEYVRSDRGRWTDQVVFRRLGGQRRVVGAKQ